MWTSWPGNFSPSLPAISPCAPSANEEPSFFLFPLSFHLHLGGVELSASEIRHAVQLALAEDIGSGDATTLATVPESAVGRGRAARARTARCCRTCLRGSRLARTSSQVKIERLARDGQSVKAGEILLRVSGPARALLSAERVALNFLQRLSGIATLTARFVDAIQGTRAQILDTRKTTPGWRRFEKYAVACGGGKNHRLGLFDMVLIKDNHLVALQNEKPDAIAAAVARAREKFPQLKIEVEADTLEQAEQAAGAGADRILLDNMNPVQLGLAVQKINGRAQTEASGGVTLANVQRHRRERRGFHFRRRAHPFGARGGPGSGF